MLRAFQIIINKLITLACKIFHRNGSVFPGSISYNIKQNILEKIKYPKFVIAVTGSSGKGTTTNCIANILKEANIDFIYNEFDSNGIRAITTLILNNCNIFGRFKHDCLLIEVDERHFHLVFGKNKPSHVVLTNITRDQPTRNTSPDIVYKSIFDALDGTSTLIINADDPILNKAKLDYPGKIITYGLAKTKDSYTKANMKNLDSVYCPNCHKKLSYRFYHYGQLGDYYCKSCDFQRGKVNYEGNNVDLTKQKMRINNTEILLNKNLLYQAYAQTAAYALADTINISIKNITNGLNKQKRSTRGNEITFADRKVIMLESKNENALSYYQSLKHIEKQEEEKTIIIGFNQVSKRYQQSDISWLYDVEFELLRNANVSKICCVGDFCYDVATRLTYAKIPEDKIILVENIETLPTIIKEQTKGTIYTIVCIDNTKTLKKLLLKGDTNGNN